MNADRRVETLRRILYEESGGQVYGILDGASIPNLLPLLTQHAIVNVCLFRGELDPGLAATAPYLVHLPPAAAFTELLLQQGWGGHWGILAVSKAELRLLRMHFRKFITVWDPAGKPLYFRYYDPRVLRVYLPTCNGDELRAVFGPVSAYLAEGETPNTLLRFTLAGETLGREALTLPPRPAA
jgi:hypothetical protein